MADAIVRQIDFDFGKSAGTGYGNIIVLRARQMDEWIRDFLEANASSIVLNLGCGLDTRISRIKPGPGVSWFDVDYPEVMELRKRFFSDLGNYRMIDSSVIESAWLETIPKDKPAMIVAEGMLEYLTAGEVSALFRRLTDHFGRGRIVFDVMSSFAINSGKSDLKKSTGAEHKWAVDDIGEVDKMNPAFKRTGNLSVFRAKGLGSLPLKSRLAYSALSLVPPFRDMLRLLRYDF